jgi:hypothetical protein
MKTFLRTPSASHLRVQCSITLTFDEIKILLRGKYKWLFHVQVLEVLVTGDQYVYIGKDSRG